MQEEQKIEEVVDKIKDNITTRYELVVLKVSDKMSTIVAESISGVIIAFVMTLTIILLSFAAAFYLSDLKNNQYTGFFIVGGFYLLLGLAFIFFRKKMLSQPFRNMIIKAMFREEAQ